MIKRFLIALCLMAAASPAWPQAGQYTNQISGNLTGSPGPARPTNLGTSVTNPGTGKLEYLLPVQTLTGASFTFGAADLFTKKRISNSGSAMAATLPSSVAAGMANGARITIGNVDATANLTLTAGSGTTIAATVIGPGRTWPLVYDLPNTAWRIDDNAAAVLLNSNNLSDLTNTTTAQSNLGLGTAATQNTGTSGVTIGLLNGANTWSALQTMGSLTVTGTFTATGLVTYADMATAAIAAASDVIAANANKLVPASAIYSSETVTTYGTTTTFDFSTFINTAVTLSGGNITTMSVANVKAGQAGQIRFIQDGTGSRTTVWNSVFKFSGAVTPTLTTTAGAIDVLFYSCISATLCYSSMTPDMR